jgi:hypothetical protein
MLWNIEGANSVTSENGHTIFEKADVILLTETFIMPDAADTLPTTHYAFHSYATKGTRGRPSGGIVILVKPELQPRRITNSTNHVAVSINNVTAVICFYFPPDYDIDNLVLEVHNVLSSITADNVIVGGDFNCRIDQGERGRDLVETLNLIGLRLVNRQDIPTYICPTGKSTIDLLLTSMPPHSLRSVEIRPTIFRKHQRVLVTFSDFCKPAEIFSKLKRSMDVAVFQSSESLAHCRAHIHHQDVDAAVECMTNAITAAASRRKQYVGHHAKWFDRECKDRKQHLTAMLSNVERTQTHNAEYWNTRRAYRELLKRKKSDYNAEQLRRRIQNAEITPWTLFKDKPTATPPPPITQNAWIEHFEALYDPTGVAPTFDNARPQYVVNEWGDRPFSENEVRTAIAQSRDNKACGCDDIYNEHIKLTVACALEIWISIFNTILACGRIPEVWRTALLKPIFKKGTPDDPGNYRGIALLSTPYKLFTKLLNMRISTNAFQHLPDEQFGFRRGRSTTSAIRSLLTAVRATLQHRRHFMYALFVDFRKAFDTVDRSRLIRKLQEQFGIGGRTLAVIQSLLQYNVIRVFDGLTQTAPILQHRGVQQGDSLSPSLFIMYIADLSAALRNILTAKHIFYADDLVFYSESADDVREALIVLENWCAENRVDLNTDKTKIMKFRRGGALRNTDRFQYNGTRIEMVNSYSYLGITLQTTLSFNEHIANKRLKCAAATGALAYLPLQSTATALQIFEMKIKPMLTYAIEEIAINLTLTQLLYIDSIKATFLKRAASIHKSASSTFIFELFRTSTLCEDLNQTVTFKDEVWEQYTARREERGMAFCAADYTAGPAFQTYEWNRANQKDRHITTRCTLHGFHHKLCINACYQPTPECQCKFCNRAASNRYHILNCPAKPANLTLINFIKSL